MVFSQHATAKLATFSIRDSGLDCDATPGKYEGEKQHPQKYCDVLLRAFNHRDGHESLTFRGKKRSNQNMKFVLPFLGVRFISLHA